MDRDFRRPRLQPQRRVSIDGFVRANTSARPRPVTAVRPSSRGLMVSLPRRPAAAAPVRPAATSTPATPNRVLHRINMTLPGAAETTAKRPVFRLKRLQSLRTWALRATAAILVLGIGGGTFGYWKVHRVFNGTTTVVALQKNVDPNLLKGEGDGRINILLLGNGGGDHDAPDLTDTIIVASIDPVNQKADLVSVPRDLWIDVPAYGKMKLNAAYETGKYAYLHKIDASNSDKKAVAAGLAMADRTLEQILGIDIHYNVLVNFKAFQKAIDTVGGVGVNVPEQLYDPTMAWENNWNPVLAKAGAQTFDGKHALMYVRSRETSSDFARSERQRSVLLALKDKVLTLGTLSNPVKTSQLLDAFGDNVYTDFSLNDSSRLMTLVKGINNDEVKSIGLADEPNSYVRTDRVGNQSVVRPSAGFFHYDDIQKYIRSTLVDGYIAKENARITVLNGSDREGLASEKANELKTYGYNVQTIGNAPTNSYQNTVVVDLTQGKDKYTKHYLEERYGVTAVRVIPDRTIQTGQADFIIILGNDETFSSQN